MFTKTLLTQMRTGSRACLSHWSNLEKTFNARPRPGPTEARTGLFRVAPLTAPEGFSALAQACVGRTAALVREALSARRRPVVAVLDELSDALCQVADLAEFIRFAHPAAAYSAAAEEAALAVSRLVERLNTDVRLYAALRRAADEGGATEADRLVAGLFLFDFEQSGIHLPEDKRNQVVELNNTILCVGQQFVHGISNPKYVRRGAVPEAVQNAFPTDGDRIIISGLYADSPNPQIREMAYRIFLHPDAGQDQLLVELLSARHTLAQVCGFETYAHRALRGSILQKPEKVMHLLETLTDLIKPKAERDFTDMLYTKGGATLAVWDVPYFTQKVKKDRFQVCAKEYSPYFSLGACMEGLNIIFSCLYGISLVESEIECGEVWSNDVYKLAVLHESEGVLGYIYCDFYERNGKPNQDCHFTIRGGKQLADEYQQPIVVLMLNFTLPKWSSPTLLSPNMVDNLFHEMGHAMHSMLARTHYQHVSGTRCSTDFAEVPSILMEYFASDYRVLKLFARHFQTKEAMPEEMVRRLCASKRLYTASETQLQVFYSALDQIYHHGGCQRGKSTTETIEEVQGRFYGLAYVESTSWQLRFSHLVGYGAKYYSYLVSRALAHLIWESYFKKDPLSRVEGERYRRECLGHGGGKDPRELIGDYLRVEPSGELLAKSLNGEVEEDQAFIADAVRKVYALR